MISDKCRSDNRTLVVFFSFLVLVASAHSDVKLRGPAAKPASQHAALQTEGDFLEVASVTEIKLSRGPDLLQMNTQLSSFNRLKTKLHSWLHPLSAGAVVTTIALQLSPLPSSLEIKRERDVKRFDGYPYFSVLAGASQWCIYGCFAAWVTHDMNFFTMVAANGPGVFFGTFYVTNFFRFVQAEDARNAALKRYLSFGFALVIAQVVACYFLGHGAVFWLGLLGSIGSAQIALSPFKTLPEVLRTRSTRSWPVDLCVWNLIQSWFTGGFGLANNDMWVFVPNLIGVIAAVFQLSLIAAFWERTGGPRGTFVRLKPTTAVEWKTTAYHSSS